jgi:hypothetical protein
MIQRQSCSFSSKIEAVAVKSYVTAKMNLIIIKQSLTLAPAGKVALKRSLNNSRAILEKAIKILKLLEAQTNLTSNGSC